MKSSSAQSHYLDVLRGIAALAVLISHADHAGLMALDLDIPQKVFLGRFGVDLFFILSGFLIWRSAQLISDANSLMIYGVHRATRLLPLYLVNIAFVVLVLPHLVSTFEPHVSWDTLLRHLALTQSLNPSVSRDLNPVLWTLTHEAIFYAVVPLLLMVPRLLLPVIGGIAFLVSWAPSTFAPFLAVFYLFTIGILLAEKRSYWALGAAVVFAAMQAMSPSHAPVEIAAMVAAGALFFLAVAAPARGLHVTLPLRWVGIVSYSLYIWHYLFINLIGTENGLRAMSTATAGLSENAVVRGALFVALVLAVSTVSYFAIERPGMGWLRKRLVLRYCSPD